MTSPELEAQDPAARHAPAPHQHVYHEEVSIAPQQMDQPANQPAPRPISPRKLAANRRNALRSTGPRTPEGKAASARNALRSTGPRSPEGKAVVAHNALQHGLWASGDLLLDG